MLAWCEARIVPKLCILIWHVDRSSQGTTNHPINRWPALRPEQQPPPFVESIVGVHTHTSTHTPTYTDLSKNFFIDSEGEVQHIVYVVVLHPLKRLVKLFIQILQITQVTGTTSWERQIMCVCCLRPTYRLTYPHTGSCSQLKSV